VRSEFESARAELRAGTPQALKQAIHEAGCSIESAMKVVLAEHQMAHGTRDAAQALFNHLEGAGIVPRRMERLVLAAATPRNQTAGHGAGAVAHDPDPSEAESVVASAAGAIAYPTADCRRHSWSEEQDGTLVPMAHQIRLDLDDASAARLAALAERAHAQQDDLAVTLLSEALAELERDTVDVVVMLDRVPGSWERMQLGREQAGRGETVGLDEL
jgi:hypothetical protein